MSPAPMLPRDPDPWLRPAQAAHRLGITLQTLRRWSEKGVIAYTLVGPFRQKRFRQSEVDRHLVAPDDSTGNI